MAAAVGREQDLSLSLSRSKKMNFSTQQPCRGVSARGCEGEESQRLLWSVGGRPCLEINISPTVFLHEWETLDDLSCFEALTVSKHMQQRFLAVYSAPYVAYAAVCLSPPHVSASNKCSRSSLGAC